MVTALALSAAFAFGIADFLGGAGARRAGTLRVLTLAVPIGLALLLPAAVLSGGTPTLASMAWGFAGGLAGGVGFITFYRALAQGPMSVVAPISALTAAVLPVAIGLLRGEDLDSRVLLGVLLCVIAIALVSMEDVTPSGTPGQGGPPAPASPTLPAPTLPAPTVPANGGWARLRGLVESGPFMAAVSGVAFGLFFILLKVAGTSPGVGLWPLTAARTAGLLVILGVVLAINRAAPPAVPGQDDPGGARARLGTASIVIASFAGLLDSGANVLYYVAARDGLLSVVAVLSSLYPAITVLLARIVYSERLRMIQRIGLGVAVAGIALVTVG